MTTASVRAAAIRIVLFDAGGTLIQPRPEVARVYREAARPYGSQLTMQEIDRRFQRALRRPFRGDGPAGLAEGRTSQHDERRRWQSMVAEVIDDISAGADELFETLWDHFADSRHWALYEDVPAAWSALEQAGLKLGVASNFDDRLLGICCHMAPLSRSHCIFHSAGVGYAKPSLKFFEAVQQYLQVPGEQILLVGDDLEYDFQAALAAGWQALLLDRSGRAPQRPHVLRSLEALPALLAGGMTA